MTDLAKKLTGKFLVLDGPDGSGKSTQIAMLAAALTEAGADVETVRDPGGTLVGDRIREILLDPGSGEIAPECETMLFMASRAQLVAECVRPALAAGRTVLCDRFVSSTLAYQGATGIAAGTIVSAADAAIGGCWPDVTVVLDLSASAGLARIGDPDQHDRMEAKGLEYHEKVRRGFLSLIDGDVYPRPVVRVNADQGRDSVFAELLAALASAME